MSVGDLTVRAGILSAGGAVTASVRLTSEDLQIAKPARARQVEAGSRWEATVARAGKRHTMPVGTQACP